MQLSDLDINKVYTYADYYKWKFEERVELIKGKIFRMSPAPSPNHQRILSRINTEIGYYLKGRKCEVFPAPFDVRISRRSAQDMDIITVLQPDLCIVCDRSKIDDRGCLGAPDLVVEILSPGNSKKEVKNKYDVYEEAGVKEYWMVDPTHQTLQINLLENGKYRPLRALTVGDMGTTTLLPGFSLDLEELFNNL